MAQTWTAYNSASAQTTNNTNFEAKLDTERSSWSGASAPSSPVVGQRWLDTSGSEDVLKVYCDLYGTGDDWYPIGSVLNGIDLGADGDPHQVVNALLERKAAHVTPDAANEGRIYLHTGEGKANVLTTSAKREVVWSAASTDHQAGDGFIPIGACDLDATNPPTPVTVGTTPTVRGKVFDATNEKCSFGFRVRQGYSGDADLKVRVVGYLANAETDSDTIDATLTYVVVKPDNNEKPTGTSTTATIAKSIGAQSDQYSLHTADFTLDFDDVTNPIEAGDWVECEFSLSSVASVAGLIVRGFQPLVPSGLKATE